MKNIIFQFVILLMSCMLSFQDLHAQFSWHQKANFGGGQRFVPFYFSIGNKGYAGSGITFSGVNYLYNNTDFWEYDPLTNVWTQKADMPGLCRSGASGFAIGKKGYVTTGWTPAQTNSTYMYNPANNSWTQKANFGGSARYSASSFTIGNYAYVGLGYAPSAKDFWKYDPFTDSWTQVADCGGQPRQAAAGFTLGGYGYIIGGTMALTSQTVNMWRYNPVSNNWSQKASLPSTARYGLAAFKMNGLGIVGLGANGNTLFNDFYAYNPKTDMWAQITSLPAAARYGGLFFSINNKGYIGCGAAGIVPTPLTQNDFWELTYEPGAKEDMQVVPGIKVIPSYNKVEFIFSEPLEKKYEIKLIDISGKIIQSISVNPGTQQTEIVLLNCSNGIYCYFIGDGNTKPFTGKFYHSK